MLLTLLVFSCIRRAMSTRKEWRKINPHEVKRLKRLKIKRDEPTYRDSQLRTKYGITLIQYDAMLQVQKGVCAVCCLPSKGKRLAVDHDHATGIVRGLLCTNCNTMIGHARDTADILLNAVRYLLFS